MEKHAPTSCSIGEGIQIRGKLSGSGDLNIHGRVSGQLQLEDHLTVAATGVVEADAEARRVTAYGTVNGDIVASEAVDLRSSARVTGNIQIEENFTMEDGAHFNGRVIMSVPLPAEFKHEHERVRR